MPKLPKGYSLGTLFNIAKGEALDTFAAQAGLIRRRLWTFRGPDWCFKNRIIKAALQEIEEEGKPE